MAAALSDGRTFAKSTDLGADEEPASMEWIARIGDDRVTRNLAIDSRYRGLG